VNTNALKNEIAAVLVEYPDAEVGVSIRDLSREVTLDINGDLVFHAASTMKIAVMIELYRQSAEGYFGLDDSLQIANKFSSIVDGSAFSIGEDSDTEIYSMLGQRVPIRNLVYRLITSSSNLATNILIGLVTADSVQATIERMGTRHMEVLRGVEDLKAFDAGMNNTTTAADLALLLEALRDGEVVSSEASSEMLKIMSDVPLEMIMAGRGERGRVAHKTGMITAHHHDAGILFPDNGQPYILVILTRGIAEEQESTKLGRMISEVVYRHLRG
jgi:beta-lactamase class A